MTAEQIVRESQFCFAVLTSREQVELVPLGIRPQALSELQRAQIAAGTLRLIGWLGINGMKTEFVPEPMQTDDPLERLWELPDTRTN
jgi:hypothetical protein